MHGDSGAHSVATSSLTMEIEVVTYAIQWLAFQRDAQITYAIIFTNSMNLLQSVGPGMGCPGWHTAMHSLRLQRLLWIYRPGQVEVNRTERADRLTGKANIGLPRLAHSHAQPSATKTSVDLLSWAHRSQRE